MYLTSTRGSVPSFCRRIDIPNPQSALRIPDHLLHILRLITRELSHFTQHLFYFLRSAWKLAFHSHRNIPIIPFLRSISHSASDLTDKILSLLCDLFSLIWEIRRTKSDEGLRPPKTWLDTGSDEEETLCSVKGPQGLPECSYGLQVLFDY